MLSDLFFAGIFSNLMSKYRGNLNKISNNPKHTDLMQIPHLHVCTWLEVEIALSNGKMVLNKKRCYEFSSFNYQNNAILKSVLWFLTD